MGYGDDILITALAANIKKKYPSRQIVIGNLKEKNAFHSVIYENNPNISDCRNLNKEKEIHLIDYHSENRPYIDYKKSTNTKYVWNKNFKPVPGELYFSQKETKIANEVVDSALKFWKQKKNLKSPKAIIFLETTSTKIKHKNFSIKHINKSWGDNNWLDLVNHLKEEYLLINSIHDKSVHFEGTYRAEKMDFRLAAAIMNLCDMYVGPEGGFSHAAGALKKKAVVYYGGWIDPKIIGYEFHENLFFDHPASPCGEYRKICDHCEKARNQLSVNMFKKKIINYKNI